MKSIENRIKELRWQNEFLLKRWFSNKATYEPATVDAEAQASLYRKSAKSLKLFSIALVVFFLIALYLPDGGIDSNTFYKLLSMGFMFYSLSYSNQLKACRFEEISNLNSLLKHNTL